MKSARSEYVMTLRRGTLWLAADLHDRYLHNIETVILLRDKSDLQILPVAHAASGGYLIKVKNRAGDRVIGAADFFRNNAIDDDVERNISVRWSSERAALIAPGLFGNKLQTKFSI